MTPQELIDLPYAGMAKFQLMRMGVWNENGRLSICYIDETTGNEIYKATPKSKEVFLK